MKYLKLSPEEHPIQKGESWWIAHPNNRELKFVAPVGAYSFCKRELKEFQEGLVYKITSNNEHSGWITLSSRESVVEMPYYVFARHFDAEVFLRSEPIQRQSWSVVNSEPLFNG